jgi:DNA polymerase/3'-5' exonuclease PolX
MQKRKCRLSKSEIECHERAVKLRKMTDEQLCRHIDDNVGKAYQEGLAKGAFENSQNQAEKSVEHFLDFLDIPGVGKTTVDKLKNYAKERGYIELG